MNQAVPGKVDMVPKSSTTKRLTPHREGDDRARSVLLALSWYYPEIHRGVAKFASEHHWHLTADLDDLVPKNWQGDGVITLLGGREQLWRRLWRVDAPIVDLSESRPDIALPRVTVDNAEIGRLAARHFLDRGHRNFAFVHRWEMGVSRARLRTFQAELRSAGFDCEILSWHRERNQQEDTRQQRHQWLVKRLTQLPRPLAAFVVRDIEAVEVIEACASADLAIPEQIAVLGVDNTETICDCLRVPLSSVETNGERVGYEGAALLDRIMNGEPLPTAPIYIPPSGIVDRRSSDSLAVDHPSVATALRFMRDFSHTPIDMSDVVKHVGMSRSGLEKAFREHYPRSPMEELRKLRMDDACRLLTETKLKIAQIAHQSGFQTSHNLCRVFRRQLGLSPNQYRAQYGSVIQH